MRTGHLDRNLVARMSRAREDLHYIIAHAETADLDVLGRAIKAVAKNLDDAATEVGDAAPDTVRSGATPYG
jgi:hypothetical protein